MASPGNRKNEGSKWLDMLVFPPTILLPVLLIALLIRSRNPSHTLDGLATSLIAAFVVAYFALSTAYMTLLKKGQKKAAWASALIADGILLLFVSAQFGAGGSFGWLGMFLLLGGLFLSISQLTPPQTARFAKNSPDLLPETIEKQDIKIFIASIPFPTAFLQKDEADIERVLTANEAFTTVTGRVGAKLDGTPFAEIIPPNMESRALVYADAEWVSHRTSKGKQTLFMLSPSVKVPEPQPLPTEYSILDVETGLYTLYYMKYKVESDAQACRRYKKRLAVVAFVLEFDGNTLIVPSDEAKQNAFAAFGQMISVSIRACDTAFRTNENEIVIFLPETSQSGAKNVSNRLIEHMRKLAKVECTELAMAKLTDTYVNFIGEEIVSLDQVMQELYIAMNRSDK